MVELKYERPEAWEMLDQKKVFVFADLYKDFLSKVKTEREAVFEIISLAKEEGFKPWPKSKDRFYVSFKDKAIALVVKGKKSADEGMFILAAHLDSPRIDIKMVPLYEDKDSHLVLLDTHYYGGIKKYQWVNHPLALHGVIVRRDGKKVEVSIGEEPDDPVLVIPDLLPHLGKKQMEKPAKEVIEGENLDAIFGHIPKSKAKKTEERIKEAVLEVLHKKYGITESDFISADLELVPAGKPRDVGIDRGLIGAYGHDDRSSVFTELMAVLNLKRKPERTVLAFFFDKEEIGSEGNTSAQSHFLRYVASLVAKDPDLALLNSIAISADVDAGMHPLYKDVFEKKNTAVLGKGVVLTKYTGHGGKYMASEARAEFVAELRAIFDKAKVPWQPGALGKVDAGGGGTVAAYLARYGMDVIDMGIPVLSMHSPFEIASKADLYSAYLAYKVFIESKL